MRNACIVILTILLVAPAYGAFGQERHGDNGHNSSPFNQSKFVPDISMVLDFSGVYRNRNDEEFASQEVPGLIHSHSEEGEDGHSHAGMNSGRGFNLNYGELGIAGAVDPYFDLYANFHLSEDGFEIEEAYVCTRDLPWGFQMRAGKFFSAFGRMNSQHAHRWDFADAPLVLKAFFGDEGLNEKGIRLAWVAPLPWYMLFGAECFQGENEASFGTEGFEGAGGSPLVEVRGAGRPQLGVSFIKVSCDVGNASVLAGASYSAGKTRINHNFSTAGTEGHAVYGDTVIAGADLVMKYAFDSYRYVALQGEYLFRYFDGDRYERDTADLVAISSLEKKQTGMYGQVVAAFARRWRAGGRYERLWNNTIEVDGSEETTPGGSLDRASGMIDYNPTEFSRIRLQYNYDRTRFAETSGGIDRRICHELIVQCNMAIGAHGAHSL